MNRSRRAAKRWRATLRAAASLFLVITLGFAGMATAHAAAVTATFAVTSTWQTGFIARFVITNASSVPLSDWRLDFDMPAGQAISHTWNSTVSQSGTHYVVTPANWNRIVAPGASTKGGFRGVLNGTYTPPSNCVLNGLYPCS